MHVPKWPNLCIISCGGVYRHLSVLVTIANMWLDSSDTAESKRALRVVWKQQHLLVVLMQLLKIVLLSPGTSMMYGSMVQKSTSGLAEVQVQRVHQQHEAAVRWQYMAQSSL